MNRNWLDKNFYRLLDVGKDADQAAIKRSYRRLAQKLHPDANPDDPNAVERFKEVSEAYSVLSDPDRRKEYDQVRSVGAGGFHGSPGGSGPFGGQQVRVEDLFGGMGGIGDLFRFGGGRRGPQRGSDVSTTLDLTFTEAVRGTTASVRIESPDTCRQCRGGGAEPGTSFDVCAGCGGTGTVASNQGFFSFTNPCPQCSGSGRTLDSPCVKCRGSGQERRVRTMKVRIPPGVKDGNTVRLRGRGSPGVRGGPPGNLLVEVRVAAHATFSLSGDDLLLKLPLTFTEAALGAKVPVPTLNGEVTLKIPPGTSSGKTFRVRKEGVRRDRGRPGDLLVTVQVAVPPKLSKDARKMLEEFRDLYETESPRDSL
jgi:molecular chaperone DnaJ